MASPCFLLGPPHPPLPRGAGGGGHNSENVEVAAF